MTEDRPRILAHPPLIVGGMVALGYVVNELLGLSLMLALVPLGPLFMVAGLSLGMAGVFEFIQAKTNVVPHKPALHLVKRGVYRFTRNPMYIGLLSIQFGCALYWNNLGILLTLPISAVMLHYGVVLKEEEYLLAKFKDDYKGFLGTTRRWFW